MFHSIELDSRQNQGDVKTVKMGSWVEAAISVLIFSCSLRSRCGTEKIPLNVLWREVCVHERVFGGAEVTLMRLTLERVH